MIYVQKLWIHIHQGIGWPISLFLPRMITNYCTVHFGYPYISFMYENHTSVYYNLCDVPLCKNVNPLYHF